MGKQITLDANHKAHIEEKPEVRHAGGVYYTPQYIVDYIVSCTVGKLLDGKTPKDATKLKLADISCGSGSFLLGAYQYLLNWHKDYYTNNGKTIGKDKPLTPEGNLTTAKKKEILLNNIYGVDIDSNAVEVTKLSLLLKCLEGETGASISTQMKLFNERILPTLDNNIKSGNSLVDLDIYNTQLDFGEERRVKPFSWEAAFPEVFKQGGFDAVIGNPPYVRQELLGKQKEYFMSRYKVYHGVADLYTYFFEKGITMLNPKGLFGIIVANKWTKATYGGPLRQWMQQQRVHEVVDFGDLTVFQGATTYPHIIIASKGSTLSEIRTTHIRTLDFADLKSYIEAHCFMIPASQLSAEGWSLVSPMKEKLFRRLKNSGLSLGEYVQGKIYRGVLTGYNEAFVIDQATKNCLVAEDRASEEVIKPYLAGRDIKRYEIPSGDKYLIFTRRGTI